MRYRTPIKSSARGAGFTLAEVMFAVLILGIGLISIASLFPAAGAIQRNTMLDVTAEFVFSNAEAKLKARGINEATLLSLVPSANSVTLLSTDNLTSIGLPPNERVFPEAYDNDNRNGTANEANEDQLLQRRQFYWEPLFHRDTKGNWKIFIFIQRRLGDVTRASATADLPFRPVNGGAANAGDYVVNATSGKVTRMTADGTASGWHSPLFGIQSTGVTVREITSGVVR